MFGVPAVLGGVGVIGVIAYNISSHARGTSVGYYGEKLGDAVAAVSLVGLALLLADALSRSAPQLRACALAGAARRPRRGAGVASRCSRSTATSGRSHDRRSPAGQAAPGIRRPTSSGPRLDHTLDPVGDSFLDAVDATRARDRADAGVLPEQYSYIDIEGLDPGRPDWTDLWFSALVGDLDTPRLNRGVLAVLAVVRGH